ncbi:MAG: 3-isopropylmalate dehydrogenase [Pseudomonadota bacterium]
MATHKLLLLPGDGIGVEAMSEVERIIALFNEAGGQTFEFEKDLVGGAAIDAIGQPVSDAAMKLADEADAVIFGAVGGPQWDNVAYDIRPEAGLLRLRKDLDLFANLRPAICYPALADASSLKRDIVEGLDILILRELTGGTYFGEPKEMVTLEDGQQRAVDTTVYTTHEVERIVKVGLDLAKVRGNKLHMAAKWNVMRSGVLWQQVTTATHKAYAPDVDLHLILADNCAMQLIRNPKQFDVIVTDNLFGDVLSDEAAMMTGSLGMLPSASLGAPNEKTGKRKSMYEPVHGSAPDIAGKGLANPIAMIASFAMALRYSLDLTDEADKIDAAIASVLAKGLRTGDIMQDGMTQVGTTDMGDAIIEELKATIS